MHKGLDIKFREEFHTCWGAFEAKYELNVKKKNFFENKNEVETNTRHMSQKIKVCVWLVEKSKLKVF